MPTICNALLNILQLLGELRLLTEHSLPGRDADLELALQRLELYINRMKLITTLPR